MLELKVKDVMVTKVVTVGVEAPMSLVEENIRVNKIRHMPVVDSANRLLGIITQRDLLRHVCPRPTEDGYMFVKEEMDQLILKHIMTPDPVTIRPEDPLKKAVEIMAREKYGCLPVVRQDKTVVGIVTQIDILRLLFKALDASSSG